MKQILTSEAINRYEVQIKSAILLAALLLFLYSFKSRVVPTNGSLKQNEHTTAK